MQIATDVSPQPTTKEVERCHKKSWFLEFIPRELPRKPLRTPLLSARLFIFGYFALMPGNIAGTHSETEPERKSHEPSVGARLPLEAF